MRSLQERVGRGGHDFTKKWFLCRIPTFAASGSKVKEFEPILESNRSNKKPNRMLLKKHGYQSDRLFCSSIPCIRDFTITNGFGPALFICRPNALSLFDVCADNSRHLHHVDRLAHFQFCKVCDLA